MKKSFFLWLLTGLLYSYAGLSQSVQVSGKIISTDQQPVAGATVSQKGTTLGTSSNERGIFNISVPADAVLVISSINYETLEVPVNGRTSINITLEPSDESLEQVVVVGYGTVRKKDLTGSVSKVTAEEINAFPTTNVVQALSGRAAGVQVKQNTGAPGANIQVRIRGTSSVQGGNEPLYVIDGFPDINPALLNSSDIESIEILKDASATAIYGSRGSNGVVIITTKQGKAGKVRVDYEGTYGTQSLRKKIELMNSQEYARFYNTMAANDNRAAFFTEDQINSFETYDWQDLIFQKAPITTQNVTVSGGNDKTRFSIGASVLGQEGIIVGSDYNRYSLRANIVTDISPVVSLNYGATISTVASDRQNSGAGNRGNSLISSVLTLAPFVNPFTSDGSLTDTRVPAVPFIGPTIHPLQYSRNQSDEEKSNFILANAALILKPFEGLTLKFSGGLQNTDSRFDSYTSLRFPQSVGSASVTSTQYRSLLSENTANYNTIIGKHSLNLLAGFTYQDFLNTSLAASGTGFLSDVTETYNLGTASTPGIPTSSYQFSTLVSYLGRFNYSYNDKYLATLTFRADGSSRYSEGNKWGYFPSGALAWRISNEPFMKDIDFISDMKIRAGYGAAGSQAIAPYSTLNLLVPGRTVFGDALYVTYAPGTRLPSSLKWETTTQADIGLDAAFLNNRYRLTLDYYIRDTDDLLNTIQLPSGFGYTETLENVGKIQNKGIEIGLEATVINSKDFSWYLNGNIAFNRSKVIALAEDKDILGGSANVTIVNDNTNLLRIGLPVGVFYGYKEEGYTATGAIKYVDQDRNNAINLLDKVVIGDPNPDFIYGLNSTMKYKGFDLTMFWQGSQGNDIVNVSAIGNSLDYTNGPNLIKDVVGNNWTPETPNAKYPRITGNFSYNFSDRFVEDGSFLRLRNIQLGYNLPLAEMGIKAIRTASVYVSGQNLLTFTKYSWFDPETNSQGGTSSLGQGIDHYSYPTSKMVTVGLKVGF